MPYEAQSKESSPHTPWIFRAAFSDHRMAYQWAKYHAPDYPYVRIVHRHTGKMLHGWYLGENRWTSLIMDPVTATGHHQYAYTK